jgi:aryl-alcohol dehydrogenase-like predicted oxidoreductase
VIAGVRTVNQVEDNVAVSGKRLATEDVARLHELYQSDFRSLAFH